MKTKILFAGLVACILLITIVVAFGVSIFLAKNKTLQNANQKQNTTNTVTPSKQSDEESLIADIRSQIPGADGESMTVTVSTITGNYAKGLISSTGGGGIWFAVKEKNTWRPIWQGNGIITCADLEAYPDLPKSLIPQCFNAKTQELEVR